MVAYQLNCRWSNSVLSDDCEQVSAGTVKLPLGRDLPAANDCLVPVISTGRCNTGFKFLFWGMVLHGLSGPLIELARGCAEFGLTEA